MHAFSLHMHAFSQEHFVGPEMLSKVISRRHMYSNCEHKLGAEKNKKIYCSLSSRVAKAHDNTHCYCYNNQKKKKKTSTSLYRSAR